MYDTPVEDRWDINGNANGGYLLALAANAMRAESGRAHPVSISMHYLSPAPAGPATTTCEVVKAGRRLSTVVASMSRDGRDIVRSIGTFGDVDASIGAQSNTLVMPQMVHVGSKISRRRSSTPDAFFKNIVLPNSSCISSSLSGNAANNSMSRAVGAITDS